MWARRGGGGSIVVHDDDDADDNYTQAAVLDTVANVTPANDDAKSCATEAHWNRGSQ